MQVKAAEIARAMGISKATVSLALNGKGGVSEQTRQEVFLCREALERGDTWKKAGPASSGQEEKGGGKALPLKPSGKEIKLVRLHRGRRGEIETGWDLHEALERGFREKGYALGVTFHDLREEAIEALWEQCNQERVAGVLVLGEELLAGEAKLFSGIQKPLLLYGADGGEGRVSCVLADEAQAMELAVSRLWDAGLKNILYLGASGESLLCERRRRGFLEAMARRGVLEASMKEMGVTAEQSYREMGRMLKKDTLPEGILFECPFVALGCIRSLLEQGVRFPEQVSLLTIDQLPSYMTGGKLVDCILLPHGQQAYWAIQLLLWEVERSNEGDAPSPFGGSHRGPGWGTGRLLLSCELREGETVRVL